MIQILYSADWVLPVSSEPIQNGAIVIEDTRIVGVGEIKNLREKFPHAIQKHFSEAVIMPGLINSHSHLELTVMRGYLEKEESDFFAWLRKLTFAKNEILTPEDMRVSATFGAAEAVRAGITCVGDACDFGTAGINSLRDVGLRGIVYQESFGPDPKLVQENFQKLTEKVSALKELENNLVRIGVSPHAPYTVCAEQLETIANYALSENLPVMMHAAESEFEKEFMQGRGAFAEGLQKRGIEWDAPRISTIQYLAQHEILKTKPLLAHCINVDERDLETIKAHGANIAHCPKSNAKLGHGFAPFASFIEHDLKVGIGSDSVASNNTNDMIDEARFALLLSRAVKKSERTLNAEDLLKTMTIGGAKALGLENKIGSLVEGKDADFIVLSLNGNHQQPVHNIVSTIIFASTGRDVLLTVIAGNEIYKDGKVLTVDEDRLKARMREMQNKIAA